jgi:alpha-tubulin suppressor-like RCC1 family protein
LNVLFGLFVLDFSHWEQEANDKSEATVTDGTESVQGICIRMIAAGAEHTTAVTEDGDLYGWGWGRYGNLGLGDRDDRFVPEKVSPVEVGNRGPA